LLKTISGLIRPNRGTHRVRRRRIDRLSPDTIVTLGISHCPEGRLLFPPQKCPCTSIWSWVRMWRRKDRALIEKLRQEVYELFPILKERSDNSRNLFWGRAANAGHRPSLDVRPQVASCSMSPSLALAPVVVSNIMDIIARIKERTVWPPSCGAERSRVSSNF